MDLFLGSSSLIRSSASDILLLILSRVFLISVIVLLVCVCLLFHSSRSLLIDSWTFSSLFSRFLIIFTIIILNSFSGNLPISSSFTWTCVFLVYSFICEVFLCLFIIFFNLLCLRSPFSRLQRWILSSFWFLPSYGWACGLCKLPIGWDLCWVFFFPLMGQGWVRW